MKIIKSILTSFAICLCLIATANLAYAQVTAGLLLNGVQQFFDNNGNPLSSGTVTTYIPGTSSLKTTWKDQAQVNPNTNPIVLDAGGKAIIYGQGLYRQVLKDRNGNLIWDAVTQPGGVVGSSTLIGDGQPVGSIKPWAGIQAPNQYIFAYGQEISRSTYPDFLTAITITETTSCTNGSNTITALVDTTQISIGVPIELTCVPLGTIVTGKTSSTVTLNNPSNVTANATAIFFPWGDGNTTTTFNVPDLRDVILAGRANMGGTDRALITSTYFGNNPTGQGIRGGSQSFTFTQPNLPNISFTNSGIAVNVTDPGHAHAGTTDAASSTAHTHTIASGITNVSTGFRAVRGAQDDGSNITSSSDSVPHTHTFTTASATTGIGVSISNQGSAASGGSGTPISVIQPTVMINYVIKITPDINQSSTDGVASLGGMTGVIACGSGLLCTGNIISLVGLGVTGVPPISVTGNAVSIIGAAGQILAGAAPAFTATPTLGASGTVGTIGFGNATSGIVTLGTVTGALGTVTASLPANAGIIAELNLAQTWTALQTVQGATTTSPGWYAQLTGDTVPRVRVGLNTVDVASIGFGSGSATRDAFIERVGAGALRFGAPDAAAPVAQTLSVQNVITGTSNTVGTNLTIAGSQGTGTGAGGSIIFQVAPAGSTGTSQNALATALTIDSTKKATFADGIVGNTLALGGATIGSNALAVTGTTLLNSALTYGGVTLNNAVTGTGNMVLSASPTLTGSPVLATPTATSLAIGGCTIGANAICATGSAAISSTLSSAADTITSASANALAVGRLGATTPAFNVDASAGTQAAGLNVAGAGTGGTVAIAAIDSGSNTNLTINAKGSGTIGIGSVSTGAVTITPATALVNGGTSTTASVYSQSDTSIATTAFVQSAINYSMATVPLAGIVGGTYSFASQGSGATLSLTQSGGVITSATVSAGGGSYVVGDVIIAAAGGYNAYLRVQTVSSGAAATVAVLYGGTGYSTATVPTLAGNVTTSPFSFSLAGVLTSNATFIMPNGALNQASNQWIINNNTTGAFSTTFFVSNGSDATTGSGVIIPQLTAGLASNSQGTFIHTDGATDAWYGSNSFGTGTGVTLSLTGVITPTALSSTTNNYNPTGLATAALIRQDLTADESLTGLAGGTPGRQIILVNISAHNLLLKNLSGSSSAANQFNLGGDVTLTPEQSVTLWYDGTASNWIVSGAYTSTGGTPTGTVQSVAPGNGLTSTLTATAPGSAITVSGTLSGAELVNAQTGTSYAILDTDRAKLVTAFNAASQAYSIAQAGNASAFQAGWYVDVHNISTNVAGIVTITPATSTINGAATLKIQPGQNVRIVSDGTNYQVVNLSLASQLPGTATNDDANAGNIGEYISSQILVGSSVSLTSSTPANVTSISLTAGDWDVWGTVAFSPAGSTVESAIVGSINTTSATLPTGPGTGAYVQVGGSSTGNVRIFSLGTTRVTVSTTTTVYLVAFALFAVSTDAAYGFIGARRVR